MEFKPSEGAEDLSLSDGWRRAILGEPSVFSDHWAPPVPVQSSLDGAFIETWVKPFYLEVNREHFESHLERRWGEITPSLVWRLLRERNWRARASGAYLAALRRFVEFEAPIGGHLLRSEAPYAGQAYCMALARFATDGAVGILIKYLDYYLPRSVLIYDQCAAMGATAFLDSALGSHHLERYRPIWDRFASDKETLDLEVAIRAFAEKMEVFAFLDELLRGR